MNSGDFSSAFWASLNIEELAPRLVKSGELTPSRASDSPTFIDNPRDAKLEYVRSGTRSNNAVKRKARDPKVTRRKELCSGAPPAEVLSVLKLSVKFWSILHHYVSF